MVAYDDTMRMRQISIMIFMFLAFSISACGDKKPAITAADINQAESRADTFVQAAADGNGKVYCASLWPFVRLAQDRTAIYSAPKARCPDLYSKKPLGMDGAALKATQRLRKALQTANINPLVDVGGGVLQSEVLVAVSRKDISSFPQDTSVDGRVKFRLLMRKFVDDKWYVVYWGLASQAQDIPPELINPPEKSTKDELTIEVPQR